MAEQPTMWVSCIECRRQTSHDVLASYRRNELDEDQVLYLHTYNVVSCRGCHTMSFAEAYGMHNAEDEYGNWLHTLTLYPNRTSGRRPIEAVGHFPPKVHRMYLETLEALNVQAPILATVGMRALAEAICLDRGCVKGKLADKINELVTKGELAQKQADFLNVHRFLGNDAAHDISPPPPAEVIAALDILESLLKTIYELPQVAAGLAASREQRRLERQGGGDSSAAEL